MHVREEDSTVTWRLGPMVERVDVVIRHAASSVSQAYAAYVCIKA